VQQVLVNLIDNAVKYSTDSSAIEVSLRTVDDRVRFSVRDDGLGIPLVEQQRIFDKFHRLDPDMTRGVGGTGLGLYICKQLVDQMNGRIWVASQEGEGSTFAFELPTASA
jgi:signal transduction histidine kinase